MTILFVGGGSLGPVMPLLAVARSLKRLVPKIACVWIGTPTGPERAVIEKEGIPFYTLPVVKWSRSPSLQWLTFPFDWARVRSLARKMVLELQPDAVVTMGGFTATPIVYAAHKKNVPCFTHQLDLVPGLANRSIAKLCESVTTSFEYEKPPFGDWVSDEPITTPSLFTLANASLRTKAVKSFGLDPKKPVTLIFGGGQGSQALNEMVERNLDEWLSFTQILHGTGLGKGTSNAKKVRPGYSVHPLFNERMIDAYASADLIVSRAGMGTLADASALKKALILVPLPDSHQEYNAQAFESHGAVVVVSQKSKTFDKDLLTTARLLLRDEKERKGMGERASAFLPTDDGTMLAKRILKRLGIG